MVPKLEGGGGTLPVRHFPPYQAGRHRCAPRSAIWARRIAIAPEQRRVRARTLWRAALALLSVAGAARRARGRRTLLLRVRRDPCSSDGLRPGCFVWNHIFDPSFHSSSSSRSDLVLAPGDRRGNARLYLYVKVRQWFSVLPAVLTPSPCSHLGEVMPPVLS